MLHGLGDVDTFKTFKAGQFPYLMGYNEPNLVSQSNLDPNHACDVWKQTMLPLRGGGTQIVSPSVSNGDTAWMDTFLSACGGVQGAGIDIMAVHVYSTSVQYAQEWISSYDKYGLPIWVTEIACMDFSYQSSCADPAAFAGEMSAWLKGRGNIVAPFIMAGDTGNVDARNALVSGNSVTPVFSAWYN